MTTHHASKLWTAEQGPLRSSVRCPRAQLLHRDARHRGVRVLHRRERRDEVVLRVHLGIDVSGRVLGLHLSRAGANGTGILSDNNSDTVNRPPVYFLASPETGEQIPVS